MYTGILTKTTETAIQCLTYLAMRGGYDELISPREIAEELDQSPSYMAKVTGLLSKANILHAQRGVTGGVSLRKTPEQITLLEIVEACQGKIIGNYCQEADDPIQVCGFHQAMLDLYRQTVETLSAWTLQDIVKKPCPAAGLLGIVECKMGKVADLAHRNETLSRVGECGTGEGI